MREVRKDFVMRVFTCNDFTGFYPVGTAAVIVADTEEAARGMLDEVLADKGLKPDPYTLVEIDVCCFQVSILCDGNY